MIKVLNNHHETILDRDSKVADSCLEACRTSYRQFLERNNIHPNTDESTKDNDKTGHIMGDTTHRKMEFTQLASKKAHFKTLVRFIKMIDIIQIRSNLQLAISVMSKLQQSLTWTESKMDQQKLFEKTKKSIYKPSVF